MKAKIIGLLLLLTVTLYAEKNFYFNAGFGTMPLLPALPSTYMSVGLRSVNHNKGWDIGLTYQSIFLLNYFSTKGLFLSYPLGPDFYWGIGPGVGSLLYPNVSVSQFAATAEGIMGYQFQREGKVKPSIQFSLTQPTYIFQDFPEMRSLTRYQYIPSFGLSFSLKF
ncbi:MAG: hypothetical protein ACKVOH_05000 [Chlamydiales bacterium]